MAKRKPITKKLRFEVLKRDNFTCQYCGKTAPDAILEIDHITPVAKGGDNNILNLISACRDCNSGKKDRKLNENQVMDKQMEQMKELNERREQFKLMVNWQKELESFEDEKVDVINEIINRRMCCSLNNKGKKDVKKLIDKYGIKEVMESTSISIEQYYEKDNNESSPQKAVEYIGRICKARKASIDNPMLQKCYYLRGILRNRFKYLSKHDEINIQKYFSKYIVSEDIYEDVKEIACSCEDKHEFWDYFFEYFIQLGVH